MSRSRSIGQRRNLTSLCVRIQLTHDPLRILLTRRNLKSSLKRGIRIVVVALLDLERTRRVLFTCAQTSTAANMLASQDLGRDMKKDGKSMQERILCSLLLFKNCNAS